MEDGPVKYNPAFLSDAALKETFVVRTADLDLVLGSIRESCSTSCQHVLVIGRRGMGKTMLVLRAALEVRRDPALREEWYPIVFAEESYQVGTAGEFWLEAVFHLARVTGDVHWKRTHAELSREQDDTRLRERALGVLLDFANSLSKRLLLVVENLDMLVGPMLNDRAGWELRHTLQNESRIFLLATATRRFEGIVNVGKPFFEMFRIQELDALNTEDCRRLWSAVTNLEAPRERARPIEILTGGNPRLVTIIAAFGASQSFSGLMKDLVRLVDDHTEYFKGHLDRLGPKERRVYLALAELWDPSTARDVAAASRQSVTATSSLLGRLQSKGAVSVTAVRGRRKWYQVTERLYNVYHLMRRRGPRSWRVRAVVDFMVGFYGQRELSERVVSIMREASALPPELRIDHHHAVFGVLNAEEVGPIRDEILANAPDQYAHAPDLPDDLLRLFADLGRRVLQIPQVEQESAGHQLFPSATPDLEKSVGVQPERSGLLTEQDSLEDAEREYRQAVAESPGSATAQLALGVFLHERRESFDEAEEAFRKALEIKPESASAWVLLGRLHERLERFEEAQEAYRKALEIDPEYALAWFRLGRLLHERLERFEEAEEAYRKAVGIEPEVALGWSHLGQLLFERLERFEEAEEAYRKAIAFEPEVALGWAQLGQLLHERLGRFEEAEEAYRKALEIKPKYALAWVLLGQLLHERLERFEEAEEAYRKVLEIDPEYASGWALLGQLLHERLERFEEAEEAYRKALEIKPEYASAGVLLGQLLHERLERFEEAEDVYRKAIGLDPKYALAWFRLGRLLHERLGRFDEAEEAYRKAIGLDPEYALAWFQLGRLLHERLERFDEAEEAYRKAIELEPEVASGWSQLGQLLHERLERFEEAEEVYRKAIELEPEVALGWAQLGRLLHERLERFDEAEEAYRKALEINSEYVWAWVNLTGLALRSRAQSEEAVQLAEEALAGPARGPQLLNGLAWQFFVHGPRDLLPKAEVWVREAIKREPSRGFYGHTLASILVAEGKLDEALTVAGQLLGDSDSVRRELSATIDLLVSLAAAGRAEDALELVVNSPSAGLLEPLSLGIRLDSAGDEDCTQVAAEILEVGRDVRDRIVARREEIR